MKKLTLKQRIISIASGWVIGGFGTVALAVVKGIIFGAPQPVDFSGAILYLTIPSLIGALVYMLISEYFMNK